MPFIRREDVDPQVRAPFDKKMKADLRAALLNPGLSPEQRRLIKEELALLGPNRLYDAERPPRF